MKGHEQMTTRRGWAIATISLIPALGAGSIGCGELDESGAGRQNGVETISSAISTTVRSNIRGFTRADGTHGAVLRDAMGNLFEMRGTPLSNSKYLGVGDTAGSDPWAYRRTDNVNAYLYVAWGDGHVHEVTPFGTGFLDNDFASAFGINAPPARADYTGVPDVIGYVRSDNTNAIVYRSSANHIIEIRDNAGGSPPWIPHDLTIDSNGPPATRGSAFPYVRSDGRNTIVYIAADNRIHEIATDLSGASDKDLFTASDETVAPSSEPWGYKRGDGINAVVYVGSDGTLRELSLFVGHPCGAKPWCRGLIQAAVAPASVRPSGYVRADGLSAVVYVSNDTTIDGSLHEVTIGPGRGWIDGAMPINPTHINGLHAYGQPFGHLAPGNRSSVLLRVTVPPANDIGTEMSLPSGSGTWGVQRF